MTHDSVPVPPSLGEAPGRDYPIRDIFQAFYPDYAANMKDDTMPASPVDGKVYAVPVNGY